MEHLPLGPQITIKPIVLRSIVVFLASLILIPTLLLILRPGTAAAWFDDSYAYRQKITFTHNANLTNASMRLTVSNTDTLVSDGKMQGDCDDTRFTDSNGKALRFKLVSGCNSASTVYDVLFPTVMSGSNLAYFYYGNPSAVSESDGSVPDGTVPSGAPSFGTEEKGPSPALYLRFDEGYGATTQDTTSNNNDGAISGAAWKTKEFCLFENCLFFDGTDDVVTVTNADSLDMDRALASGMTYQAWVRVNSDGEGSAGQIFNKGTNTYLRITNEGADAAADVEASLALATSNATVTITDGIELNTWTHIAVAYTDDADDEITVYINGVQKGASTNGSGAPAADANNLLIGGPTTANFHGFIDEFKVYPVERTSEQIKTDTTKATSLHGVSASFGDDQSFVSEGLVGYWKLDESSGNAADSSGNATTLTNNDSTNYTGGKFGNSGWFNAASSDYFSTATTINNINTVSFWASPSATTDEFINLTASARITASSGTVSFTGATSPSVYVNGVLNGTITADTWNHIVAVTTTPMNADAFEIGRANNAYTNGKIDDVRLYNRTLSSSEISRLYDWGPGPIGHWTFDERTGTSAFDSSGNANTGTLTNGPQWTTGKLGQALEFDGVDDQVDLATNAIDNRTEFTLSLWFKTKSTVLGHLYMEFDQSGSQRNVTMQIEDGQISFVWRGVASGWCSSGNSTLYNDGQWHHAVGVVNNGTAILYIDGAFIESSTCSFQSINADIKGFGLVGAWGGRWQGSIDDVRVYNYALTPKQIVSIMNADHPSVGSPVGSAIGHWKFDEGFGTTANDASINTNNLTLNTASAAWLTDGKFDKAWHGYGSNWLSRADDDDFDFAATDDFAISTWFRSGSPTNPGVVQYLVDKYGGSQGYALYANTNGTVCIGIDDDASWDPDVSACSTTDIYDQQWHHLVATRNISQDTLSLFVDGKLAQSSNDTTIATLANTTTLYVGDDDGDATNSFTGDLDELKIYRYALTSDEVKVEYNQGKSIVLGSLSTDPDGITASNSAARAYCPPGDTATCNPPVGHWTFDERTGTTANDISGNANTGTLTNDPKWEKGKLGQALEFDGNNDHILVPDSTLWDFAGKAMSLNFWLKSAGTNNDGTILEHHSGSTGWNIRLEENDGASAGQVFFDHEATGDLIDLKSSAVNDNSWHHITFTIDGSTARVYVDGQFESSDAYSALTDRTTETLNIGFFGGIATNYLRGLLDDVRIYNYTRTPAQVAWDYNQGKPLAHYKFDECTGTTAYDSATKSDLSSTRYDGTINPTSSGNTAAGSCNSGVSTEMWNDGTSGKFNASLGFDGTDDYVNSSFVQNWSATDSFSYSLWFKTDTISNTTDRELLGVTETAGFGAPEIILEIDGDGSLCADETILFLVEDNDDAGFDIVCSTYTVADTDWHHVVAIYNDVGANMLIYVDGSLRATAAVTSLSADAKTFTRPMFIGANNSAGTANQFFNGQIDDVRIYNYVLTPAQTRTVYNENSAVRFGPLTGSP